MGVNEELLKKIGHYVDSNSLVRCLEKYQLAVGNVEHVYDDHMCRQNVHSLRNDTPILNNQLWPMQSGEELHFEEVAFVIRENGWESYLDMLVYQGSYPFRYRDDLSYYECTRHYSGLSG